VRKVHSFETFIRTARKGLESGAVMRSASVMHWDLAPKCERPISRTLTARERPVGTPWQDNAKVFTNRRDIDFETRCRKCPPCLKIRAAYWRVRAVSETVGHPRTWFVTLTLNPDSHFTMLCRASQRLRARDEDFDQLDAERQFAERHIEISKELTLWLKRVRKASGAKLRYCLVAERHKTGLPHYHALVHECGAEQPVRAAVLRGQWKLGFSTVKLVAQDEQAGAASYVAKYLAKSASARVRASVGYGQICAPPRSQNIIKCETMTPKEKENKINEFINSVVCTEPSDFRPWASIYENPRDCTPERVFTTLGQSL
jgi:hypothetical protein